MTPSTYHLVPHLDLFVVGTRSFGFWSPRFTPGSPGFPQGYPGTPMGCPGCLVNLSTSSGGG
ncbi:hypothetical protein D9757_010185 [Collybiopsis confluens]|uniref:Uncharacterized protein n=1 Tax=Collybiopsis confluens TaxID=2823264 RepID=A0A8H5H0X2_9AGAR|nr:hypothetical protein D9757_010185 [Collybiopsis confluens]